MSSPWLVTKRIWTDPVGSKIIAGTILAVTAWVWVSYRAGLFKTYPIPVWAILLLATALIGLSPWLHLRSRESISSNNADSTLRIEKAGTLKNCAEQADWLAKNLEEVWHLHLQEKKYFPNPLSVRAIPDEIKEWPDKQLWRFRVLYGSHLDFLKKVDPEFHSTVVDEGIRCDGQDYLTVKRKIGDHAELLRKRANELLTTAVGPNG